MVVYFSILYILYCEYKVKMTELKREYVIPLRRKTILAPKWRRSKKAMSVLKDFIRKHMKADNVIICNELNEFIWANGIKNPPGKVSVVAYKKTFADGVERCIVNLSSVGVEEVLKSYEEMPAKLDVEQKESESLSSEEKPEGENENKEKSEVIEEKEENKDKKKDSEEKKEVKEE